MNRLITLVLLLSTATLACAAENPIDFADRLYNAAAAGNFDRVKELRREGFTLSILLYRKNDQTTLEVARQFPVIAQYLEQSHAFLTRYNNQPVQQLIHESERIYRIKERLEQ